MLEEIVSSVGPARGARALAGAVNRLISADVFAPGDRLPTVRAIAGALHLSPTTVSEAWQQLAAVGAIESRGRSGTFVRGEQRPSAPRRYRRITEGPGHFALDLSTGIPDPRLLPDLRAALRKVASSHPTTSYLDASVLPSLEGLLRGRWPFAPESLTVTDGSMDALDRLAQEFVRFGDRVLVEDPTFPPILDLLEALGAEVIGLDMDAEGVTVSSLQAGLALDPVAIVLQPRAQNPTGISMTARRAKRLAKELASSRAWVIEDDHSGDIAMAPEVSLGTWLPAQTVRVFGFSKSHGPDLRLAAIGGAAEPIERLAIRRLLGPGWSSRLLQGALAHLLVDPGSIASVAHAREEYSTRRSRVAQALAASGVGTTGSDGINLWIEVHDEQDALLTLAASGIGAAPGRPFEVRPAATDHLRATVGLVEGKVKPFVDRLVEAAGARDVTVRVVS